MTQPFYFPDGRVANSPEDLLELCEQYPDDATGFLVRQDLEKWLAYIGSYDVAECAVHARQINASDRLKLADFLNKCHSLAAPEPVPPAEPEIDLEGNLTSQAVFVPPSAEAELPSQQPEQQPIAPTPEQSKVTASTVAKAIPPQKPASSSKVLSTTVLSTSANTANDSKSSAKPSFFQVVAKFIVQILYLNKA